MFKLYDIVCSQFLGNCEQAKSRSLIFTQAGVHGSSSSSGSASPLAANDSARQQPLRGAAAHPALPAKQKAHDLPSPKDTRPCGARPGIRSLSSRFLNRAM